MAMRTTKSVLVNTTNEEQKEQFFNAVLSVAKRMNIDQDLLSECMILLNDYIDNIPPDMDYRMGNAFMKLKRAYEAFMKGEPHHVVVKYIKESLPKTKTYVVKNLHDSENYDYYVEHLFYESGCYDIHPSLVEEEKDTVNTQIFSDNFLSEQSRSFLSKLSQFSFEKLQDSLNRIVLSRLGGKTENDRLTIINQCIERMAEEFEGKGTEYIDYFFKNRSSEWFYIALWARIRMGWINIIKKNGKATSRKRKRRKKS